MYSIYHLRSNFMYNPSSVKAKYVGSVIKHRNYNQMCIVYHSLFVSASRQDTLLRYFSDHSWRTRVDRSGTVVDDKGRQGVPGVRVFESANLSQYATMEWTRCQSKKRHDWYRINHARQLQDMFLGYMTHELCIRRLWREFQCSESSYLRGSWGQYEER